jgi:replicative DNA helicase
LTNLSRNEEEALDLFVHTPAESQSGFLRFAEETASMEGVKFGCILDKHIIPLRPGRVMGLLARSGSGKTTLGSALLLQEARRIRDRGMSDNQCVIHVTWEQSVEEIEAYYHNHDGYTTTDVAWGKVPIDTLKRDAIHGERMNLPVWVFGDSLHRTDQDTPPMTLQRVYDGIRAVRKKWRMQPRLLMFDYIQDIPVPDERDRYSQVSQAVRQVSRLAVQIQCPILLGIQANQRTDDRADPMPGMRDTEWSAVIHQKVDGMMAIMRPRRYWTPDDMPVVMVGGKEYPNCDELTAVRLLKQRGDKGYGTWAIHFDVTTMTISDWPDDPFEAVPVRDVYL